MDFLTLDNKWIFGGELLIPFVPEDYLGMSSDFDWNIAIERSSSAELEFQYKLGEDGLWTTLCTTYVGSGYGENTQYAHVPAGTTIYFRKAGTYFNSNDKSNHFRCSGSVSNFSYDVFGKLNSLISKEDNGVWDGTNTISPYTPYCYQYLFANEPVRHASGLILQGGEIVGNYAYYYMFGACNKLETAPLLPANEELAQGCYKSMFNGCLALTGAPSNLPATTIHNETYSSMFQGCTSLKTPPYSIGTATLTESTCENMFYHCTSLTASPNLDVSTVGVKSCTRMFASCTSLKEVPTLYLQATTVATSSYAYMFESCTHLSSAPTLPATTLGNYCYEAMFASCNKLSSIPNLPADTLAKGCYRKMFYNAGIRKIDSGRISGITLAEDCCMEMFQSCTSLSSVDANIGFKDSTYSYTSAFAEMFRGCTKLSAIPSGFFPNITEFGNYGCAGMFQGCTQLTAMPELNNFITQSACFANMFNGCSKLTKTCVLKPIAYENLANGWASGMFRNCNSLTSLTAQMINWGAPNTTDSSIYDEYYTSAWVSGITTTGTYYYIKDFQGELLSSGDKVPIYWNTQVITSEVIDPAPIPIQSTVITNGKIRIIMLPRRKDTLYGGSSIKIRNQNNDRIKALWDKATQKLTLQNQTQGTTQTYTRGQDGKIWINNVPYEVMDFEEYPDPFMMSSMIMSSFHIHIDNNDTQGYHWGIITVDPEEPELGINGIWLRAKKDIDVLIDALQAKYPVYIYNLGANLMNAEGEHTHIYTTAQRLIGQYQTEEYINPIRIDGQFDSLTGQMRPTKALYKGEFKGLFSGWSALCSMSPTMLLPWLEGINIPCACFDSMFSGCTGLTGNLHFNADLSDDSFTFNSNGYQMNSMFKGCTSLTNVGYALPISITAPYSHQSLFEGCTSLARITVNQVYSGQDSDMRVGSLKGMFKGCTSLYDPNITLYFHTDSGNYCYKDMFSGCTSLTVAPIVDGHSQVLGQGACQCMLADTSIQGFNLTQFAPEQYYIQSAEGMLSGCTNLTLGNVTLGTSDNVKWPNFSLLGIPASGFTQTGVKTLTAGESYTAPSPGWVSFNIIGPGGDRSIRNPGACTRLIVNNKLIPVERSGGANGAHAELFPVKAGDVISYQTELAGKQPGGSNTEYYVTCKYAQSLIDGDLYYPDYSYLTGGDDTLDIGRDNQWYASSDSWIKLTIFSGYSGWNANCVSTWMGPSSTSGSACLRILGIGNATPARPLFIPIKAGYAFRWSCPDNTISASVQVAPCQAGSKVGYPDYQGLSEGLWDNSTTRGQKIIQNHQTETADYNGWLLVNCCPGTLSYVEGCCKILLNTQNFAEGVPLMRYWPNSWGQSWLLPVKAGTTMNLVAQPDGAATVKAVFCPDLGKGYTAGQGGGGTLLDWSDIPFIGGSNGIYDHGCANMFQGCTALQYGAVFGPSVTVNVTGYNNLYGACKQMYKDCISLKALRNESQINITNNYVGTQIVDGCTVTNATYYTANDDEYNGINCESLPGNWTKVKI